MRRLVLSMGEPLMPSWNCRGGGLEAAATAGWPLITGATVGIGFCLRVSSSVGLVG